MGGRDLPELSGLAQLLGYSGRGGEVGLCRGELSEFESGDEPVEMGGDDSLLLAAQFCDLAELVGERDPLSDRVGGDDRGEAAV